MRISLFFIILSLSFALSACKKALEHPETSDPVYNDIKKQETKAYSEYKSKEKEVAAAKKAFDEAPVQTGQRLEAQEEYFEKVNAAQKIAEKYRYLALKAELQKKHDRLVYPDFFKNNLPWPDANSVADYEMDKKLAQAPREWSPEKRLKDRELKKEGERKPASHEEKGEGAE